MKTRRYLLSAISAITLGAVCLTTHAQNSPVGTWDVVISGDYTGNGLINFNPDFSISGVQFTALPVGSTKPDESRFDPQLGRFDDANDGGGATNAADRLYGSSDVGGTWTYDENGKVIGIFTASSHSGTNYFTNGVSFRATVKPRKLSMSLYSTNGNFTFRGIPAAAAPSLDGTWYASIDREGQYSIELFSLASVPGVANLYTYAGQGANDIQAGNALLSSQNRLSIVTSNGDPTNEVIRALSGSIKVSKGKAILRGSDGNSKILFRATKQ